jgi:hypothetical protein
MPSLGCPWLFVKGNDTTFQVDNNLLNKSKFQDNIGKDITDKYIISKSPGIFDNLITFSIEETAIDTTYINSAKLYKVLHPLGTKLCITEDNRIAIFDSASVISVDGADIDGTDITDNIQFHKEPKQNAFSDTLEHLYARFPDNSNGNAIIANFKLKPWQIVSQKNLDGLINIKIENGNVNSYFARREYNSITAISIDSSFLNPNIIDLDIDWYRGNLIRYIAIANLEYSGFTITELPLNEAFSSYYNDELANLNNIDSLYSIVDPSKSLILNFSNNSSKSSSTFIKDYILEVNGRIGSYLNNNTKIIKSLVNNSSNNLINYKNKLNNNYPNPFNPITKINYSIKKQGLVTLKIYDILGREIKCLVNEIKNPGEYLVEFNGSYFSSGVYFYRLETNGFSDIKRMILIK